MKPEKTKVLKFRLNKLARDEDKEATRKRRARVKAKNSHKHFHIRGER